MRLYPLPPEHEIIEANLDLLETDRLSTELTQVYKGVLAKDSRLGRVPIIPIEDDEELSYGYARTASAATNGVPEVHIPIVPAGTDEPEIGGPFVVPGALEVVADCAGIDLEKLTPGAFRVIALAHEFGHVADDYDHQDDIKAYRLQRSAEWEAMPLGRYATSQLMDPANPVHDRLTEFIENGYPINGRVYTTHDEAYLAQYTAFVGLTTERAADSFARSVLAVTFGNDFEITDIIGT